MSKFEDYPSKCVKCGATDVELHKFTYAKSKGKMLSESFRTVQISFPVCFSCKQEFEKSLKIENAYESMRYVSLCSFIIVVAMGFTVFSGGSNWWTILLFVITSILTLVGIIYALRSFGDPNKISNFIYLSKTGKVKIKDKEFAEEIAEHFVTKKIEELTSGSQRTPMIKCPKCGSQQPQGTDFCNVCGKNMRNL